MSNTRLAVLLLAGFVAWRMFNPPVPEPSPGVLVAEAPQQWGPEADAQWQRDVHSFTPLADFALSARVLGREDYRAGREAELSPTDLALGWGPMSDSAVLEHLDISQGGRWYRYRWGAEGPPIPPADIVRSSANMHMIPADPEVAAVLDEVREGQVIELRGKLVEIRSGDGWRWRSSTSREDSGGGSCEVVWVESLRIRD